MKGISYFTKFSFGLLSAVILSACHGENAGNIMACYFTRGILQAPNVPADLCTHIIYAFGVMSPSGITPQTQGDIQAYKDLVRLKERNPGLKVLISIQQGFNTVVDKGTTAISKFCYQASSFLKKNGFDGLDLDWEYPKSSEKKAYMLFMKLLGTYLHIRGFLLSTALPNNPIIFDLGYDAQTLKKHMDFMTVMTYDFHVYIQGRDNVTGYNSPLVAPPQEYKYLSTKGMLNYMVNAGLPEDKLLMGIASYGRSWKLADPKSHALHAPAIGKGDPGPVTRIKGLYLQKDVCYAVSKGASIVDDATNGAQYLYKDTTWVSYDGKFSIKTKLSWLSTTSFRGVGIWALQLDDTTGFCKQGRFPLLNYIKSLLF